MALFKVVKFQVRGESNSFRVNIDGNGTFWCELSQVMSKALSLGKIEAPNFKEIEARIFNAVKKYNDLHTKNEYVVKYRFHFSPRIKKQMPLSVMDEDSWKKTQGAGNQGFYNDEIGIIIVWYPMVKTKLGDTIVTKKMRVATEDDVNYVGRYGELFRNDLHKPYSELLFFAYEGHWAFDNEKLFFEIPLTDETYTFFEGIEKNLVNIMTFMFNFLSSDPELLLNNIKQALLSKGKNLLNV